MKSTVLAVLSAFTVVGSGPTAVGNLAQAYTAEEVSAAALAPNPLDSRLVQARDAMRKRDRVRLVQARDALMAVRHPLALWADYWELSVRLSEATPEEVEAFYTRWPGSYVEDRLRNDWLLELGKRRDWRNFAIDYPRFRMNDDRQVSCYAQFLRFQAGDDVRATARALWLAQKDGDDGCTLLASTLYAAQQFKAADLWLKARQAAEGKRLTAARQALTVLGEDTALLNEVFEQPQRFLARRSTEGALAPGRSSELVAMALAVQAANDPTDAALQLQQRWQALLPAEVAAWTWASVARQGALKLLPDADGWFQRAVSVAEGRDVDWGDDTLGWRVRSALRASDAGRWQRVLDAIALMSGPAQAEPVWMYWKARALQGSARPGPEGDAQRTAGNLLQERIASQLNFYGQLAADDLGRPQPMPSRPAALTAEERGQALQNPGLTRALAMMGLGLRGEGVREWNFTVREMNDRQLLAAAQRACDSQVWDRCISTSERTRQEIDMAQRFPQPFRQEVMAAAQEVGIDPAYVYGLIRQESRFVTDARSGVGASGLMQVMPATARWTAKKLGLPYSAELITDKAVNLKIGSGYLKLILADFGGSQAMAAAAYNAGPNRPRRWREGPVMEVAAWAENIPFNETRDYVKKVLSNAAYYTAVMNGRTEVSLKPRLSPLVGPRLADAPPEDRQLP